MVDCHLTFDYRRWLVPSTETDGCACWPERSMSNLYRRCTDGCQCRILTARAMTRAAATREIAACSIMAIFALRVSGIVSVGLNAVALVNET